MSPEIILFNAALGLTSPWQVVKVEFDQAAKELHLFVDFPSGSRFSCPDCGLTCSVYDSEPDRLWRHLNFFEHQTFLHARFPRVTCKACGVKTVEGSWARVGSGFTLLFEAFALLLCKQMPVRAASALLGEHDTRLWHLVAHYVEQAHGDQDLSQIHSVKVDETARRPGHEYVTLFANGETDGKDASMFDSFLQELQTHGGSGEQIESFSLDMSPAFESGVTRDFPHAPQVIDRFHVVKMVGDAIDHVRRAEVREHPELKKTRYLWLENPEHLTDRQKQTVEDFCAMQPTLRTVQAYRSKRALQKLWDLSDRKTAADYLWAWCQNSETILAEIVATIRKQAHRILNYFTADRQTNGMTADRQTNGMMEGINSIVQAAKARARGYRSDRYLKWMINLVVGKLNFTNPDYPH